jgi:hypothetical protein
LFSSSKRALISTRAVTFLPLSAASIRAATIGLSLEVRYSVCLIASTLGSRAAWRRNCTTTSKLSNGWWTRMSFSRIAAKQSPPWSRTRSGKRAL